MSVDTKRLIERAAEASGQSVADFVVTTLADHAAAVLDRRPLSNRDRDRFLEIMNSADEPTERLRKAARDARRPSPR